MIYKFNEIREEIIFIIVLMRMLHKYEKEWYKHKDIRVQVSRYYSKVRGISKTTRAKYRILTHCADCGICFLTASSNRGRKDIRCPFGCRKQHKKEASKKRVNEYRKTPKGKRNKEKLNENRYRQSNKSSEKTEKEKSPSEEKGSFVGYVRFIVSLIECRFISWKEMKNILLEYFKKWRQHPLEYWLEVCNMTV